MKKMFLFAAMASVAFASCTTDEKVFDGTDESNEIRFTAAQYSAQSRAAGDEHETGDAFTQEIKIWSWYSGENTPVIPGDIYTYNGTSGSFEDGRKYYWPTDGTALDFVAVPSLVGSAYFTAPGRAADGATALTFVIPDGNNYHSTNLMTTQLVKSQTSGTIALLFRHLLSKVQIKVVQGKRDNSDARWLVTVNDIKVSGLKCAGEVVINQDWDATANPETGCSWDVVSGSETWQVTDGAKKLYASIDAGASQTNYSSDDTYYMLPQELVDQEITINYTVETDFLGNETQPNTSKTYSKEILVKNAGISQWYMNKNIVYTITINPEDVTEITFKVNEEEWGGGSGSGSI